MEAANGKVTVRFLGSLKDVFRQTEMSLDLARARTAGDLLGFICTTPEQTQTIYAQPGSVRPGVNVLVNGRNIAFAERLDTSLHDGDLVTVFLPTAGG